ncbi:hypothetical protein ACWEKT_28240 [Nocardia takedensis]
MKTWNDLDAATRAAIRRGEPATDPEIDLIARTHAERQLGRATTRALAIGIPFGLIAGFFGAYAVDELDLGMGRFIAVVIAAAVTYVLFATKRRMALLRIVNASPGTPREPVAPGAPDPLTVRVPADGFFRMMSGWLIVVAILVVASGAFPDPVLWMVTALVAVPALGYCAYILLFWILPRRPLYVLDSAGVLPDGIASPIPWDAIREIRVLPMRATAAYTRQVLTFILHDRDRYLRQLPWFPRLLSKLAPTAYLSPLTISTGITDTAIPTIAATVAALSGKIVTVTPPPTTTSTEDTAGNR